MKLREQLPLRGLAAALALVLAAAVLLIPSSASAASLAKKTARFDSSAAKSSCKLTVKTIKGDASNVAATVQAVARSRAFPGLANNRDTTVTCWIVDGTATVIGGTVSKGDWYVNSTQTATIPASGTGYFICGQSHVDLRYGDDVYSSPIVCA